MPTYEIAELNIGIIRGPIGSSHIEIMHRRGEWFERMSEDYMVLWWVPRGHRPTVTEAMERLEALKRKGPHAEDFTFRQTFPPPEATSPRPPTSKSSH